MGEFPFLAPGIGRGHRDLDPPDTGGDQRADLEQAQADGAAGGVGELGKTQPDPAQRAQQDIGHRSEPQAQLIGAHRGGGGAVGEQVGLALLDAVLHFTASAVYFLVKVPRLGIAARQRGHDKARIGVALRHLGLGNDTSLPAPAGEGLVAQFPEAPGRLARLAAFRASLGQLLADPADQAVVAGQAEQIINPVRLAPCDQLLAAKAAVGAQQDPRPGPAGADLRDKPRDLFAGARCAVDIGRSQLGREQVATAEDVERQVAIAVIVAVEEPPFLVSVDRIIGGIEIENNLLGGLGMRLDEQLPEQGLDRGRIMADPVVFRRLRPAQFQPVERALARQRCAVAAMGAELADQGGHHRIVTQLVVIVEILVAQANPEHPLADQGGHFVLDKICPAMIGETAGKTVHQLDRPVRGPQQQRASIAGHRAAVERRDNRA